MYQDAISEVTLYCLEDYIISVDVAVSTVCIKSVCRASVDKGWTPIVFVPLGVMAANLHAADRTCALSALLSSFRVATRLNCPN